MSRICIRCLTGQVIDSNEHGFVRYQCQNNRCNFIYPGGLNPDDINRPFFIAVIGATSSGKSTFLGSLVHKFIYDVVHNGFLSLLMDFEFFDDELKNLPPQDIAEDTVLSIGQIVRYILEYNTYPPATNEMAEANLGADNNSVLLLRSKITHRTLIFNFLDIAGEDLANISLNSITADRYRVFAMADAGIFILDPAYMASLYNRIGDHDNFRNNQIQDIGIYERRQPLSILRNYRDLLYGHAGAPPSGQAVGGTFLSRLSALFSNSPHSYKIRKKPLAVCINKFDKIIESGSNSNLVMNMESMSGRGFSREDIIKRVNNRHITVADIRTGDHHPDLDHGDSILSMSHQIKLQYEEFHKRLSVFLKQNDTQLCNAIDQLFSKYHFFPLVSCFFDNEHRRDPLQPLYSHGVIEPILWILEELKFTKF